ncbi:conserved hypothetical protein [Microsporum canis CBS 113480]|uniref:Uncharacterized protein n=1 Tax=Arthroderma otae (strain ATCC MYA-4605 / CBS 113480) TaxID=554155 RepID=C5FP77_ARTOC|nr:conserved hypothetical protein [Microsporum canis CBS 113480]EEQ31393.1 conserved hypothetical protein [Microsporum canis CBS 113480]
MDSLGRKKVLDGYDCINLDGLKEEISRFLGLECCFIMDTQKRPFGGTVEWAEGTQLQWTETWPNVPQRDKVIQSVAHTVISLLKIQNKTFLFTLYRIIDLGFAEMIPLQFAACFPNFLTHDFQSLHDQAEVEHGNTHGPLVWRPKNTPMMRRDRAFYLQCVKELSEGDPMLEEYYRLLADKDEIRRYWWLMAATKLKVHRAMAACNWLRP